MSCTGLHFEIQVNGSGYFRSLACPRIVFCSAKFNNIDNQVKQASPHAIYTTVHILTLKAPRTKIAAEDNFFFFFYLSK